jgi:hypothetical protein
MPSRAELEAMKEEVSKYLSEGLKKHTLGAPLDEEKIKNELNKLLERMETEAGLPLELKKYNELASELLSTSFLGIPEGFDPHTSLRAMPTHFLVMLREMFSHSHGYPLNIIWLEILHRQGELIGDWSFERISNTEAKLQFQLKKPLDYIALNLTVNEEKKN